MSPMDWSEKVVLVTGAARGMGLAFAQRFAAAGAAAKRRAKARPMPLAAPVTRTTFSDQSTGLMSAQ